MKMLFILTENPNQVKGSKYLQQAEYSDKKHKINIDYKIRHVLKLDKLSISWKIPNSVFFEAPKTQISTFWRSADGFHSFGLLFMKKIQY